MFILDNNKITEMTFKNSQNIDIISFSKPRLKLLKDNRFSIRSNATYLTDPSISVNNVLSPTVRFPSLSMPHLYQPAILFFPPQNFLLFSHLSSSCMA